MPQIMNTKSAFLLEDMNYLQAYLADCQIRTLNKVSAVIIIIDATQIIHQTNITKASRYVRYNENKKPKIVKITSNFSHDAGRCNVRIKMAA